MRGRVVLAGVVLGGTVGMVSGAWGDTIHLRNGSAIVVEAWRDTGDAVEFAKGGGIIRIAKTEIQRIDGRPSKDDLKMYAAPASAAARPPADPAATAKQLADLLRQGETLFGQTVLTAAEKTSALRRLGERWKEVEAPDALRDAHTRGQRALQLALDAFVAEGAGTAPDVKERIEAARKELADAQVELQKAGTPKASGG